MEISLLFDSNDAPLASIIILNFNGKLFLETCLSSVLETKYPNYEVVLVDNGSTDCSLNLAEKAFGSDKRLRIIRIPKNIGFSGGANVGFSHSKGSYIVFLNNDTIVDSSWLTYLIDALKRDPTIGTAAPMILEYSGTEIQSAGALLSDYFLTVFVIGKGMPSSLEFPPTFEVSYASGVAMITRRELISQVGLFDPKIPFNYEETLLSFKTWLAGKRVVTVSGSKVRHRWHGTIKMDTPAPHYHGLIAKICFMFDCYSSPSDLAKAFFVFAIHQLPYYSSFIKKGRPQIIYANIKAIFWSLRNLKYIWQNRLFNRSINRISMEQGVSKFIRLNLPASVALRKGWGIYCENQAEKYQNSLIYTSNVRQESC